MEVIVDQSWTFRVRLAGASSAPLISPSPLGPAVSAAPPILSEVPEARAMASPAKDELQMDHVGSNVALRPNRHAGARRST